MKKIRGKNFYRDEITTINKKNKNSYALKELYRIADLYYRAYDKEMYVTMTDDEFMLLHCIRDLLLMENPVDLKHADMLIRAIKNNPAPVAVAPAQPGGITA